MLQLFIGPQDGDCHFGYRLAGRQTYAENLFISLSLNLYRAQAAPFQTYFEMLQAPYPQKTSSGKRIQKPNPDNKKMSNPLLNIQHKKI